MKEYEYKVVKLELNAFSSQEKMLKRLEEQLNQYGKSGWILCSMQSNLAYLRRELTKANVVYNFILNMYGMKLM